MGIQKETKLRKLLIHWPPKTVATSCWMRSLGISAQLVKRYVESGWIEPIGHGAFKKSNEVIEWQGALNALQSQMEIPVHVGGLTAISFHGASHYIRMGQETVFLFSPPKIHLPKWLCQYNWSHPIKHVKTAFLEERLGTNVYKHHDIDIRVSTLERAILECLYLSPNHVDLVECYQITESLLTLRPKLVQTLMEACSSIKVKRLFLFMAEKASLPVIKHLKLENIDLGKGDRSIVPHGLYNAKYGLILPKELTQNL